jgi:hypothetical protein
VFAITKEKEMLFYITSLGLIAPIMVFIVIFFQVIRRSELASHSVRGIEQLLPCFFGRALCKAL